MPRWEEKRTFGCSITRVYGIDRAKDAVAKMSEIGYVSTSRLVLELKYPGIGSPPRIPGGDITYTTRLNFAAVWRVVRDAVRASGNGYVVNVTGTKGIGKSCHLRALAWAMILAGQKVVCLWSLANAYSNLLEALIAALCFTYCKDDAVLGQVDDLKSLEDVVGFLKSRVAAGEVLYLIVDGAEVLDTVTTGKPRYDKDTREAVDNYLQTLSKVAHVTIYGLSPAVNNSRKRKAEESWIQNEYEAYVDKASILGKLSCWQDEIDYYADIHPLSLSILGNCCREWARKRKRDPLALPGVGTALSDEEIVRLLQDRCEWEEVLKLFVSSSEMSMSSMRVQLDETLKDLDAGFHSRSSMMERDMRFVMGDPKEFDAQYATPYIARAYIEAFRDAEGKTLFKGSTWYNYCRHLLHDMNRINWAEMGWLCENLAAEVISTKGLALEGLVLVGMHTERFAAVPDYRSWVGSVSAGCGIYFVPMLYKCPIDGLIVSQDAGRVLHLIAIQVTPNPEKRTADEFMSFNSVTQWIPEAELDKWKLHYVFICCEDSPKLKVGDTRKSVITEGTVGYSLHKKSFLRAFAGTVDPNVNKTLQDIAQRRYDACVAEAEETVQ